MHHLTNRHDTPNIRPGRAARSRALVLLAALFSVGCVPPTAPTPDASPADNLPPARVDLPAPIRLEGTIPPETHADQTMRVDGLLARREKYMGQKILVRGYLVEKSECPKEARRCERPHGWLADTPAGGDKKLMLVGLTEPLLELLEVGQQHVVTGKFDRRSEDGFVMSSGLLIYEKIEGIELPETPEPKKRKWR